jgi:hypothetical protein
VARLFASASSEYLEIDSTPVTAAPFTVAGWAYFGSLTENAVAMAIADKDSGTAYWTLQFYGTQAGDPVLWQARSGGTYALAMSTSGYSAGTWHHLCGVETASNSRAVFLDGGSKGTNSDTASPAGADRLSLGRVGDSSPGLYLNGGLAEGAIWNVALTDAEVALLARGYSPLLVRPESLVFYAPLIRDTDDDLVGGLQLTAYNTPSITAHPRIIYPGRVQIGVPAAGGGDVTVAPSSAAAVGAGSDPAVVLGGVAVAPAAAGAVGGSGAPSVVLGGITLTPDASGAVGGAVGPVVVLGATAIAPAEASAVGGTAGPAVVLGSVTVTPAASGAVAGEVDPVVVLGSVAIAPTACAAVATVVDPAVLAGDIIITPGAVSTVAGSVAPAIVLGSVAIVPVPTGAVAGRVDPAVVLGSLVLATAAASAVAASVDPNVPLVGVLVTPAAVHAVAGTAAPAVVLGSVAVAPGAGVAIAGVLPPTVVLGSMTVTPPTAATVVGSVAPTVTLSVLFQELVMAVAYAKMVEERAGAVKREHGGTSYVCTVREAEGKL